MFRKQIKSKTSFAINKSVEGETIEQKIERIVNNNEPIKDGAPIIYQERSKGVEPGYDIRTDRFEIAVDAMDKIDKASKAKREERQMKILKKDSEAETIQGQADQNQTNN